MASLDRYEPEILGIYEKGGRQFSSLLEYFSLLLNGEWRPVPLPRAPISEVLMTTRPFFGAEAMEYRTPTHTRLGAFLGIKAVSYTHLDVYKRQPPHRASSSWIRNFNPVLSKQGTSRMRTVSLISTSLAF